MAETPTNTHSKGAETLESTSSKQKKKNRKDKDKSQSNSDQERSGNDSATLSTVPEEEEDKRTIEEKMNDLTLFVTNALGAITNATSSVQSNLDKDRYGKQHKKEKKRRKERTNSVAQSVADSAVKKDWKELQSYYSSGDSSSSSSSSDSSSDSDSDSSQWWRQEKAKAKKKKKKKKKKSSKKKKISHDTDDEQEEKDQSGGESDDSGKESSSKKKGTFNSNRLFRSLEDTERHAAQTVIHVTRQEKECPVRISDFSISNLCKAMKNIIQFQEKEDTKVKMTKVLSESCKRHLEIKYKVMKSDLIDMSLSTIFTIMARETVVHSKGQFYEAMKKALSHITLMEWNKLNASTHETFYFQQLALVEEFMMIFRIMLTENKRHCPKIHDKEGGLIKLFKSFHNYEYWKQIWGDMKQKYNNMAEFMEEYQDKAMQAYHLSIAFKELPYKSRETDKPLDKDRDRQYYDKKREISKNLNRNNTYPHRDKSNNNSFNHINQDTGYDSEDPYDPTWVNANPEQASELEEDQKQDLDEDSLSEASNEDREVNDEIMELHLAAFGEHNVVNKDKKDLPCLRKLMAGKCEREECPFGHKREVLQKGAIDMAAKLKAFTESQGSNNTSAPFKVLQKEKYGKN